jgi:hypothetical protein
MAESILNVLTTSPFIQIWTENEVESDVSAGYTRDTWGQTAIQNTGAGESNTFDIEGTLDGANWVKLGNTIAAAGVTQVPAGVYRFIRVVRKSGKAKLSICMYSNDKLMK